MEKMEMQSKNLVDENISKIAQLFPNCITEGKNEEGQVVKLVDFDLLKQELSKEIVEGNDERYTLNWAGKKQAILTANSPINATLRPCRKESVDADGTKGDDSKSKFDSQNLYIEGDNLDVLKLLRETYLGKVKMIYIDPPYNTGNDFVYEDDFATSTEDYLQASKSYDEQGNRMFQNSDSNGRFHSDWLSMMYSRLKVAKDLLSDDGVIFISIDDNEQNNLQKLCNEIFGEKNFLANLIVTSAPAGTQSSVDFAVQQSYCLVFRKSDKFQTKNIVLTTKEINEKYSYGKDDNGAYYIERLWKRGIGGRMEDVPSLHFPVYFNKKTNEILIDKEIDKVNKSEYIKIIPYQTAGVLGRWTWSREKMINERESLTVVMVAGEYKLHKKVYSYQDAGRKPYTIIDSKLGRTELGSIEIKNIFNEKTFDYPKFSGLIKYFANLVQDNKAIFMDFFSGSATTADGVMQLNAEDGGNRKFIMVQLPENCDEKSEAYKAGYKNICEIGKERIRRAGKKIVGKLKEDMRYENKNTEEHTRIGNPITNSSYTTKDEHGELNTFVANQQDAKDYYKFHPEDLDIGFRVLKLDSSNMKDIYYKPAELNQASLLDYVSNIKEDRTPEDLLFQVMLDMGVMLSSEIKTIDIKGKKVFNVNDGNLVCCFDKDLTDEVVTEIAKMQPLYAVFRDSSMSSDSVAVNFDQIFETYSPTTTRKVL